MEKIRIVGGKPLVGEINISGAKNAALPLLTASLLTEGVLTLENIPDLADIHSMTALLNHLGVDVQLNFPHATLKASILF